MAREALKLVIGESVTMAKMANKSEHGECKVRSTSAAFLIASECRFLRLLPSMDAPLLRQQQTMSHTIEIGQGEERMYI